MIIRGSFDPDYGRPYVEGLLFIPSWNMSSHIDFLVDTGADATTLNPGDGKRMRVDYKNLAYTSPALGVGSAHKDAEVNAVVAFAGESGELPYYGIRLTITPYKKKLEGLPSLLGTDILQRWRMTWDFPQQVLDFEVLSCDGTVPNNP